MQEKDLQVSISNLYAKFFESEKKVHPTCQCSNEVKIKNVKLGMIFIDYGICEKCQRITFYKEVKEFTRGNYVLEWKEIPVLEIKSELEKHLECIIDENDLVHYSSNFDILLEKIGKVFNQKATTLPKT